MLTSTLVANQPLVKPRTRAACLPLGRNRLAGQHAYLARSTDTGRYSKDQWLSPVGCRSWPRVENAELVVGDAVAMVNFCLYKQIASIVLSPDFPGWLAPLHLNWTRFGEFCGLTATLTGTWVAAGLLLGAYRTAATADLPAALRAACLTWLAAMPVAAAQLVLATAAESRALVGDADFASAVPLAASGLGEPFVSASGVLALMSLWRCVYALFLDPFGLKGLGFRREQFMRELYSFREALLVVCIIAGMGSMSLQVAQALDTLASAGSGM
ncbi:hypothetical protein Agub_g6237 [Astrephomene gubernaculifera]|uniref:Uncharacterized protein n=1 Tax=Astrephomene gubernaculifera TaxID=47775 RepID=A0AAD3DNJ0_9CHLO|nr:hypothetical protein Agub_g6237 [Astrephomene gubernaculifera]